MMLWINYDYKKWDDPLFVFLSDGSANGKIVNEESMIYKVKFARFFS